MSKVFLSYAREDGAAVDRLYADLKSLGADPWMDKHDLIPGQGWKGAIKAAVRGSSHFIFVLSTHSVRKRGYAQREIREAIDVLKEIPPDEIFIIPARLDSVTSPYEELQDLNWVDLFPSYADGLERIRKALEVSGGLEATSLAQTLPEQRDSVRIKLYRQVFDRGAFQLPCLFEYALPEVQEAAQDILAALSTGKVYSRQGRLLLEVPPKSEFESASYVQGLDEISAFLVLLRHQTRDLLAALADLAGTSTTKLVSSLHNMEFLLNDLISGGASREQVTHLLLLMDELDTTRNRTIKVLNLLLQSGGHKLLPYITVSSDQLKRSAELEENNGEGSQRWGDYYLRTHRFLSAFLGRESHTGCPTGLPRI